MKVPVKYRLRFWDKVVMRGERDCWEWVGAISSSGYGSFTFLGKSITAHRFSFLMNCGNIPKGLLVLHLCDNKKCVNPDHLRTGTQSDNMRGAVRKYKMNVGEKNGNAKLSEVDVVLIREEYSTNKTPIKKHELAEKYNVHYSVINNVLTRRTWKHI